MWILVELLLFAILVDSAKLPKKNPLVVYVQEDTGNSVRNEEVPKVVNENKLSKYQDVFQSLLGSMNVEQDEIISVDKALRSAVGSRCTRLLRCRNSCKRNANSNKCEKECKTAIDKDNLCVDKKQEVKETKKESEECAVDEEKNESKCSEEKEKKPESKECELDEEKKEFNCSATKEVDECANEEEATHCSKRSFRAKKGKKKRRFRSVN